MQMKDSEQMVNKKLERIWKEAVIANLRRCQQY